jgi:hypothetical protein
MRVYAMEVMVGRIRERGLRRADRCRDVPTFLQSGCTFVATRLSFVQQQLKRALSHRRELRSRNRCGYKSELVASRSHVRAKVAGDNTTNFSSIYLYIAPPSYRRRFPDDHADFASRSLNLWSMFQDGRVRTSVSQRHPSDSSAYI